MREMNYHVKKGVSLKNTQSDIKRITLLSLLWVTSFKIFKREK